MVFLVVPYGFQASKLAGLNPVNIDGFFSGPILVSGFKACGFKSGQYRWFFSGPILVSGFRACEFKSGQYRFFSQKNPNYGLLRMRKSRGWSHGVDLLLAYIK